MSVADMAPTTVHVPRYTTAHTPLTLTAHFKDSGPLDVERSRKRAYPGLPCPAPRTASVYSAFAELLGNSKTIWDVGCGSGLGSAILQQAGHSVLGVDLDPNAVGFARSFAPSVRFDAVSSLNGEACPDAVVLVDVLGFDRSPRETLFHLHQLAPNASWLIAEPRASLSQRLCAPHRTAFSEDSLRATLTRAGVAVTDTFSCSTFTMAVAAPFSLAVGRAFDIAAKQQHVGHFEQALATLADLTEDQDPDVARAAQLDSAELHSCMGDGDASSAGYLRILGNSPRNPEALAALSQLTLAGGNLSDALSLAVQAMDSDSANASAACSLALAAERLSPAEGFKSWQFAAALAPAEPVIQSRLAEYAAETGHSDMAIAALEQLRAHNADQGADFHVTLAWLLLDAGRPQDAKLEARIASTVAPNSPGIPELWDALSNN